ncbi:50S ribosomal protein L4 [Vallitalea okinawensis]|uniref:50S ribosomal protein L4 n=1 Tax=Vallitalea okinawensis TaxID=2078660 RepID=UPI000CFDEA26|nr:50S ribosomal protein L4 [Vallitalea okinawensis]
MAKVTVFDMNGKQVGEIELNDAVFGIEVNTHVMHRAVVGHLANKRQGTQSAKTRSEVRGGGAKPWRQKGTGRARQGTIRAPHWTGGGVAFAPKPRDYSQKLNKKERRLALKSALTSKVADQKIIVVDDLTMGEVKTKTFKTALDALNIKKALVVTGEQNVVLSARNIPGVETTKADRLNVYDILKYDAFVVSKADIAKIEEVYA